MDRKKAFILSTIAGSAFVSAISCNRVQSDEKPLNIVYIMCDDHSYQTLSAYDSSYIHTPNIDRIARMGARFTNSFVSNSLSGPSRACLLTGKHSYANGFINNETTFNPSQQTFPKILQNNGYQTAMVGKWHLVSAPEGFDFWKILDGQGQYYGPDILSAEDTVRYSGYVTDVITDIALEWLDGRDEDKPFCLLLHHKAPHRAWEPDVRDLDLFADREFPLPHTFYDKYNGRLAAELAEMGVASELRMLEDLKIYHEDKQGVKKYYTGRMTQGQRQIWDAHYDAVNEKFREESPVGEELDRWKFNRYMRDYLRCIASVDRNVGRILDYLQNNNLLENTVIVYTSDQGFYMGEHGWFDKRFMYEQSMRTPLLVYYPSGVRGDIDALVQNIDYAPTFLQLASLQVPDDMHGVSLLPLLKGEELESPREGIYYHYHEYPAEHAVRKHFGIRTDRYKLIRFYSDSTDALKVERSWQKDKQRGLVEVNCWELYDLSKDPFELDNIYGQEGTEEITLQLKDMLKELQSQYGESSFWRD